MPLQTLGVALRGCELRQKVSLEGPSSHQSSLPLFQPRLNFFQLRLQLVGDIGLKHIRTVGFFLSTEAWVEHEFVVPFWPCHDRRQWRRCVPSTPKAWPPQPRRSRRHASGGRGGALRARARGQEERGGAAPLVGRSGGPGGGRRARRRRAVWRPQAPQKRPALQWRGIAASSVHQADSAAVLEQGRRPRKGRQRRLRATRGRARGPRGRPPWARGSGGLRWRGPRPSCAGSSDCQRSCRLR